MSAAIDTPARPGLTRAARAAFVRDGFVILRGLADAGRVRAMRAVALDHAARRLPPIEYEADVAYPGAPASRDADGGDTPRRLLQAYDRDPLFADWAADTRLTAAVAALLDSDCLWLTRNHHNCIMTKQPRFSTATAWHRDLRYWSFRQPRLVNAWLALGDETPANGGMRLLPGTQRTHFTHDRMDAQQFLRTDLDANAALVDTAVAAVLAPGDVLLFDAATLHAAGANTSDALKLSLVTTYYGADNAPLAGTRSARLAPVRVRAADHA